MEGEYPTPLAPAPKFSYEHDCGKEDLVMYWLLG